MKNHKQDQQNNNVRKENDLWARDIKHTVTLIAKQLADTFKKKN